MLTEDVSWVRFVVGFVLLAIILTAILGNVLVCWAICADRRLRKLGNLFIVSLAVADLLVSCIVMTFALANDLMGYWAFGPQFCDTWIAMDVMCSTASILNLCAISLDRFIHIKDPLRYCRWMSKRVVLMVIAALWMLSALVSFLPISLGWHRPPAPATRSPGRVVVVPPLVESSASSPDKGGGVVVVVRTEGHVEMGSAPPDTLVGSPNNFSLPAGLGPLENSTFHPPSLDPFRASPTTLPPARVDGYPFIGAAVDVDSLATLPVSSTAVAESAAASTTTSTPGRGRRSLRHEEGYHDTQRFGSRASDALVAASDSSGEITANAATTAAAALTQRRRRNAGGAPAAALPECAFDLTKEYAVSSSLISFYIPCVVMIALYCRLYFYARKHVKNIRALNKPLNGGGPMAHSASHHQTHDHKAAVTLGIIVGVFLVCWVPFFAVNIAAPFCKTCIPDVVFKILTWLGYFNSALNPIIYSIFNTEFRDAFRKIITTHCLALVKPCNASRSGPHHFHQTRQRPSAAGAAEAHRHLPLSQLGGHHQPLQPHQQCQPQVVRKNNNYSDSYAPAPNCSSLLLSADSNAEGADLHAIEDRAEVCYNSPSPVNGRSAVLSPAIETCQVSSI